MNNICVLDKDETTMVSDMKLSDGKNGICNNYGCTMDQEGVRAGLVVMLRLGTLSVSAQ